MKILFDEPTHTYTNTKTKVNYISVTTLIGNYKNPFDSQYWSVYKAVKDVLSDNDKFEEFKRSAGSWKNVVNTWNAFPIPEFQDAVQSRQEHYLLKWELQSDEACMKGTLEHKKRELESESSNYYETNSEKYETPKIHDQKDILAVQDFGTNRIYTELLVYNDHYQVAGQVDWVRKKGKSIWIKDYKTNKEITKKSFMNKKMKAPLSNLPDANWHHYAMQLSTYGWMLEECGYVVKGLELVHTKENEIIEMPYLKSEVMLMMEDYAEF